MNNKWITGILISYLLSPGLQGQTTSKMVRLPLHIPNMHFGSIPFKEILVLDNRLEPAKIFTDESGGYPVITYTFDRSGANTIKEYLDKAITPLAKGSKTLVVSIEQLRIPNKRNILRKGGKDLRKGAKPSTGIVPLRDYLLFSAEAYCQTANNRYRKILTVREYSYTYGIYNKLGQLIAGLLNDLLEAVSDDKAPPVRSKSRNRINYLWEDSLSENYSKDTSELTMEQINNNVRDKWAHYPILTSRHEMSGVYPNFDDFKNDSLLLQQVQVRWDEKDSLYKINTLQDHSGNKGNFHWAVCDKGDLYLWLYGESYLKLDRRPNGFYFTIPRTLPDMYSLLSIEESQASTNQASPHTGNPFADLGALLIGDAAGDAYKKAGQKRMARTGLKSEAFRHCFIDMDSGDIVY